jgi:hypothetical protein
MKPYSITPKNMHNERSKVNKSHFKFNGNFKNHITFGITLGSFITLLKFKIPLNAQKFI